MRTLMLLLAAGCGPKIQVPTPLTPDAAPVQPAAPPPPSEMVRLDGTEPVIGDPNAPIIVVQYSDFLCPHCAKGFAALSAAIPARPDVALVFKTFPLSMECNPDLGVSTLADRCTLAYAAECGARQGKFQATATAIFDDIPMVSAVGATPERLAGIASRSGLDKTTFDLCMADPAVRDAVIVDAREGHRLAIRGTPTFWVSRRDSGKFEVFEGDTATVITAIDALRSDP